MSPETLTEPATYFVFWLLNKIAVWRLTRCTEVRRSTSLEPERISTTR